MLSSINVYSSNIQLKTVLINVNFGDFIFLSDFFKFMSLDYHNANTCPTSGRNRCSLVDMIGFS